MNFRMRSGPDPTRELPRRPFRDRIAPKTSVAVRISVQRAPPARLLTSRSSSTCRGIRNSRIVPSINDQVLDHKITLRIQPLSIQGEARLRGQTAEVFQSILVGALG